MARESSLFGVMATATKRKSSIIVRKVAVKMGKLEASVPPVHPGKILREDFSKLLALTIHKQQIDHYGGIDGVRDSGLLESALFRPQSGYYNSVAEESAALMESLANNHPFLDGDKSIA